MSPALSSAYNANIDQVNSGADNSKSKGLKLEKEIFQLEKAKQVVSQNMSAIFTLLAIVANWVSAWLKLASFNAMN
ncbi:MAG: hypothetical protein JJV92_02595 [Desulfosarcina sp.]|nr:hypothetical protein [Desulfobacterales bacterium]